MPNGLQSSPARKSREAWRAGGFARPASHEAGHGRNCVQGGGREASERSRWRTMMETPAEMPVVAADHSVEPPSRARVERRRWLLARARRFQSWAMRVGPRPQRGESKAARCGWRLRMQDWACAGNADRCRRRRTARVSRVHAARAEWSSDPLPSSRENRARAPARAGVRRGWVRRLWRRRACGVQSKAAGFRRLARVTAVPAFIG